MCDVTESFTIKLQSSSEKNNIWKYKTTGIPDHKRVMSFIDNLWGLEITGGKDQYEPLTVIGVRKNGLARRAGIKVGDCITQINNTPADELTLLEAQIEIQESGRSLKIVVSGDSDESSNSEDEANSVDFWFKPMKPEELNLLEWERKQNEKRRTTMLKYQQANVGWNDRKKPVLRSSNCFMVPEKRHEREIKLKVSRDRYNYSEKERLAKVENQRHIK